MPKKFKGGENSKAATARARKAETKAAESAKKEKEKEDEYWRDDNKHIAKKQQRKADSEKKKQEQIARKQEARKLLEEEESALPIKPAGAKPSKLTRAQIEAIQERERAEAEQARKQKDRMPEVPLEENPNIAVAEAAAKGQLEARSVEDAIAVLDVNEPKVDIHPEKRMKAAFLAYEEIHLPILKAENPNLRLSQLKQMLKKDWMKAPENPLNQR
ncbi:coiled-coil domain-containing protein 124-like [Amphiura filiformis]|uniref:coiled-coil domain-containing protein 124-like n=1 Tax=Amphiura filiformis TaxID=82378 RepID=UPI003B21FD27